MDNRREADPMSSEVSNRGNSLCLNLPVEEIGKACTNPVVFPTQLPIGDSPKFPSPVQRSVIKESSEDKRLDYLLLAHQSPVREIWSYIPNKILNDERSSQAIPGHFVQVADSPTAPVPWHGPNIMGALTQISDVFHYVQEDLGAHWAEWVELHITGFSPLHFPPRPVWRRTEAFHIHISSHLADCDGLGAVRFEALHHHRELGTPYLQIIIRVRPPRLRRLAQARFHRQ
ncbi:hypothetical protein N7523_005812 [Penicillium sp. IBT 18751x]|nr:hypothetical protein N7523_005812 [Penicillium sp. IBT 18751x]